MASEIRVDKINSLSGVGTVTLSPTGVDIAGITTVATFKVGTGVTASSDGDIFATGVCTATTFSGSGASLTNLPAANITGTLPAISGANLTNLDASDLASGTVPTARLGSGTASSSTFLRGDSTFAAVTSTTINSNTNNYIITGTGTANELQGESELQWNGSNLFVRAGESEAASLNLIADQGDDNGDGWKIQSEQDENDLTFKSNVSGSYVDKLKLKNSGQLEAQGHITLVSGANVVMASGQGIDFSATGGPTSGSDSSELLDDYEEGTFTPNWDAGGGVTFSYNHQHGFYTKIGDTVTFQVYLMGHASSISSGNGGNGVVIQGLPYTIQNHSRYYPAFTIGRTYNVDINDNKRLYSYGDSNSTNIRLILEEGDTVGSLLTAQQLDRNPCLMQVGGVYRI